MMKKQERMSFLKFYTDEMKKMDELKNENQWKPGNH